VGLGQFGVSGNSIIGIAAIDDVAFHDVSVGSICCCLFAFVRSFGNWVIDVRDELWVVFEASSVQYG